MQNQTNGPFMDKTYLGDSIYASSDGYQIELTVDNGSGASHAIYLDPSVMDAFFRYFEKIFEVKIDIRKADPQSAEAN